MHDEKQIADGLLAPLGLRLEHESWPVDCLVVKMDTLAQSIDTNVECVYGAEVVGTSCKSLQSFGTGRDFMEHLKFIAAFVVSKTEMSWMRGAAYDAEPFLERTIVKTIQNPYFGCSSLEEMEIKKDLLGG